MLGSEDDTVGKSASVHSHRKCGLCLGFCDLEGALRGSLGSCTALPVLDNPQSVAQTQQGQVVPGSAHGMWLECVEFLEWHLCVWDKCAVLGALEKNARGSWCPCKCHGIVIPAVCEC